MSQRRRQSRPRVDGGINHGAEPAENMERTDIRADIGHTGAAWPTSTDPPLLTDLRRPCPRLREAWVGGLRGASSERLSSGRRYRYTERGKGMGKGSGEGEGGWCPSRPTNLERHRQRCNAAAAAAGWRPGGPISGRERSGHGSNQRPARCGRVTPPPYMVQLRHSPPRGSATAHHAATPTWPHPTWFSSATAHHAAPQQPALHGATLHGPDPSQPTLHSPVPQQPTLHGPVPP